MQYTIEARALTSETSHRTSFDVESRRTVVEASDESDAISQYVKASESELVSFSQPARGAESIATVKKEDAVFLVRVYAA